MFGRVGGEGWVVESYGDRLPHPIVPWFWQFALTLHCVNPLTNDTTKEIFYNILFGAALGVYVQNLSELCCICVNKIDFSFNFPEDLVSSFSFPWDKEFIYIQCLGLLLVFFKQCNRKENIYLNIVLEMAEKYYTEL